MYYVYLHKKASSGEPFYVGKGRKSRAYRQSGRSEYWQRIVKKHGLIVEILEHFLFEEAAYTRERDLVRELSQSHKLCNITSGGDGGYSVARTGEHRKAIAKMLQKRNKSKEHRAKISATNTGKKHTAKTLKKMAAAKAGITGAAHNSFKGAIEACCLATGATSLYAGEKALEDAGFTSQLVYKVLSGNRVKHKNHTFRRLPNGHTVV